MHLAHLLRSPALDLLLTLERDRFQIEATETDALRIAPADRLHPDQAAQVRRYKVELPALIRACDEGVQVRLEAFRDQYRQTPAPKLPAFIFRPGTPYRAGACCSCGVALPAAVTRTVTCRRPDGTSTDVVLTQRYGRCWQCAFAWRLAVGVSLPTPLAEVRDEATVAS